MLLTALFILGISVEAVTGSISAGRKDMDIFGVIMIASITGLGGGTVRDVLLDQHPLIWIEHPAYLMVTILSSVVTLVFASWLLRMMKVFLILDALGLAAFVILGTQKAMMNGFPATICIFSGLITGISGGMLRDILCNDIPLVLRRELYAVVALMGAVFYYLLSLTTLNPTGVTIVVLLFIFCFRVWAIKYHIEMPKFSYRKSLRNSARLNRRKPSRKQ